ncbi:MAG: hypothetical protein UY07_C0011G0011 [Parcubacteria group bacterium GW2011_GWA1_47_8]|nr:MAG: hypothetical protein UY07_C0011G0011 [Parcubacteria group bacterium GW2011_GWA1_47_8]
MIETIINSEAFLIVISGVLIFIFQNLISQLWISPIVEFKKCMSKIDTLLARWGFLYKFEYGKSQSLSSPNGTMDEAIENFRKEIGNFATELIGAYNSLPLLEKLWLRVRGIDVKSAKPALLTLSVSISAEDDWKTGASKAKSEMDKIYKYLRITDWEEK